MRVSKVGISSSAGPPVLASLSYRVCSVVASFRYKGPLDLVEVQRRLLADYNVKQVRFDPSRHPTMTAKLVKPKSVLIFFADGHGLAQSNTNTHLKTAIHYVWNIIKGTPIVKGSDPKISIVNLVITGDLGRSLDVEEFTQNSPFKCIYEPEQFPGVLLSLPEPRVTFLLFASGRFTATGLSSGREIPRSLQTLTQAVQPYVEG